MFRPLAWSLLAVAALFGCTNYTPSPSAKISNIAEPPQPGSPTLSPTGGAAPRPIMREGILTDADNGKTLLLTGASNITINLQGNATTGYSWSLAGIDGPALEAVGDVVYTPNPNQPGMTGSGGTSSAKFRVARTGQSRITLQYARPWEKNAPARTFTITFIVDKLPG